MQPLRGTDSIMWTIKFRNGNMKRFKFPIRTTPEGSIDPYAGKPAADMAKIEDRVSSPGKRLPCRQSQRTDSRLIPVTSEHFLRGNYNGR